MQRKYLINEDELTSLVKDAMILEYVEEVYTKEYDIAREAVGEELEHLGVPMDEYLAFYYQRALKEE